MFVLVVIGTRKPIVNFISLRHLRTWRSVEMNDLAIRLPIFTNCYARAPLHEKVEFDLAKPDGILRISLENTNSLCISNKARRKNSRPAIIDQNRKR